MKECDIELGSRLFLGAVDLPVFGSSFALLMLWMMSRMDLMVPFILKFPVHFLISIFSHSKYVFRVLWSFVP
jgi:hypothetical protein